MTRETNLDTKAAHKHFSASCFNAAWDLIDKADRTPEENEQMILLNQASLWHWSQREDCTSKSKSIGYWQTSRIYALLGQTANALRYGELCLESSRDEEPFYLGYAYEALARAVSISGDRSKLQEYLNAARQQAEKVTDADPRKALLDDLQNIQPVS